MDTPLPFDAAAFDPIEQFVLNERARTSVQPDANAAAGAKQVAAAPAATSTDAAGDDREFEEVAAIVLMMVATLLERQMDQDDAQRGGVLVVRVVNKYFPDAHVGPELALLGWAGLWYAMSKPLPKPSNPDNGPTDGKAAQPS